MPVVSVVVLAHGEEPHLRACVDAVLASVPGETGQDLEVLVVDNGAPAAIAALPDDDRVRVVTPGRNTGFAGGCNLGSSEARGDVLVFANSDVVVQPEAVQALDEAVRGSRDLVCGCVLLPGGRVNAVGNPVHFTGMAWSGGFGEAPEEHLTPKEVTCVTGALFAVDRATWEALQGFDDAYFAYHEDVELSLRAWQRGGRVRYIPAARATHHYEFHRNPEKLYLLERNRLLTVLTTYPAPLLRRLLPALLLFEVLIWCSALVQGWLPSKARSYRWLLAHRADIRDRRRATQARSTLTAAQFAQLLSARLEPANVQSPPGLPLLNVVLAKLFAIAVRGLSSSASAHSGSSRL